MQEIFVGNVISNVRIEKQIFKGSNKVFIGSDEKTKEKMVVKVLDVRGWDGSIQKSVEAESKIGLHISKNCLFLVKIHEILTRSDFVYIIMEYCPEGDLTIEIGNRINQNKPFSDDEILEIMFQLGKAVEALHAANVVHRDLKTDNVFIARKDERGILLKIGDFGISREMKSSKENTTVVMGTIGYTPPEVLNGEPYNEACDIYSLGVIFMELIDLRHPFMNAKGIIQQGRIFTGQCNTAQSSLSPIQQSLRNLALEMLSVDPTKRPTIEAVLALPLFTHFLNRIYERYLTLPYASAQKPSTGATSPALPSASASLPSHVRDPALGTMMTIAKAAASVPQIPVAGAQNFPIAFVPKAAPDGAKYTGTKILNIKEKSSYWVVYISHDLSSSPGIFCLNASISGSVYIGITEKKRFLSSCSDQLYGRGVKASVMSDDRLYIGGESVGSFFGWNSTSIVSSHTSVSLELNQSAHTLHFFVRGKQLPYCVTDVPMDVLYAVGNFYSFEDGVIDLHSLQMRNTTAVDAKVNCQKLPWN